VADANEPDKATEDGDDPKARELISAPQHVVHECGHESRPNASNGSAVQAELAGSSAAAKNKVLAGVMSSKATDHQSKVSGVHCLSDNDRSCNEEDVEEEHPDCLEETSEQAEERPKGRGSNEDERLILATVKVVSSLSEERSHDEDANCP
jgi:hypothetical protein